jgi:fructokinase
MLGRIVSIGEVVWDIFGDRQVLGGAPVNVAYHLHTLSVPSIIITRVGDDALGEATRKKIVQLGLPTAGMQTDDLYATGTVVVTVAENNEPSFDIVEPAAWDFIEVAAAEKAVGDAPFYLIFGTLAQRHPGSRDAIRALWNVAEKRLYDVNLRPPFTTQELVVDSLHAADIVKMNEHELQIIAGWCRIKGPDAAKQAEIFRDRFTLEAVVITAGGEGAWLVSSDGYFRHAGFPVAVVDTVGAGDAFFATFIEGYMKKKPWLECLTRANHRGSYVASRQGATPPMEGYQYKTEG